MANRYTSWNIKPPPRVKGRKAPISRQSRMEQGQQFKALYASLGFNAHEVAQLLQVSPRSVHNWVSGAVPVPFMAVKLLRLMLRYELPGKAWEGWHLSAGRLYTPEGFELDPREVSWWSLLVRQARMFRRVYLGTSSLVAGRTARTAADVRPGAGQRTAAKSGPSSEAGRPAQPAGPNLFLSHIPTRDVEREASHA